MSIIFLILITVFLYFTWIRYFPVRNIPCIKNGAQELNNMKLDIRDYHESSHDHIQGSIHIPYAYLKRFYNEIPKTQIHVIASDQLELNLGLRFLRGKGYKVISYELMKCPCSEKGA
ncbi:rhodanese-like domain-containing protein [Niallia sp. Krafla_26]|uniref:rhodanese-like domain-containing protein n=1 Tax=Niallia sp. Krafla_26 TaxID=3064703 RepID=UPI003D17B45D